MNTFQIITDSCCDFTDAMYTAYRVTAAPMTLLYMGQEQQNFNDSARMKEFYDGLRKGATASTAAVNPDGWARIMEPVLARGEDILCLTFSAALSTTHQSAVIAAEELSEKYPDRRIRVVDSRCAALGQGLLLHHTCLRRDTGMDLDTLTAWVEENKGRLCHWVTVDDLQHLKRGGRISSATALVGGMLHIKPIIHIDAEGRLQNIAKARGRKAALELLAGKVADGDPTNETVFIGHGDCPEDAAHLEALIREKCPWVKETVIGYVGGVIGAHTGPGVIAVFYLGDNR